MTNKKTAGAPKKFPDTETEILHIRKKVPKGTATLLKKKMDKMISESLTLEQRIEQFYNRDKEKFTPYSQISQKNREVIIEILNNK